MNRLGVSACSAKMEIMSVRRFAALDWCASLVEDKSFFSERVPFLSPRKT